MINECGFAYICTGDNKILSHGAAKETRGEVAKGTRIMIMNIYDDTNYENEIN